LFLLRFSPMFQEETPGVDAADDDGDDDGDE
jgi:hypothetical protein